MCFVFVVAVLFSSCNKETTAPDSPLANFRKHICKLPIWDKYTTAQLVSEIMLYPNIDSIVQPKYDVTAAAFFINPRFSKP